MKKRQKKATGNDAMQKRSKSAPNKYLNKKSAK